MLQHRMLALFYRAWADQTPAVQDERGGGGRMRAMLAALAGARRRRRSGAEKLGQAAALGHQVLGPERLAGLLAAAVGAPVAIDEFVGAWAADPAPAADPPRRRPRRARPRRRARAARLLAAEPHRAPRRAAGARPTTCDFLPGGRRLGALRTAVLHGLGETLDVDVRPVLRARRVPDARLGVGEARPDRLAAPRRGRPTPPTCASAAVVGLAAEGARAAA